MKMLLTILLKIPHNVTEVMVMLMVLLLVLKLVQSGVHHKKGALSRKSEIFNDKKIYYQKLFSLS